MLTLRVEGRELFDEIRDEFITIKPATLQLEHSLISISKWEAKWEKPFLSTGDKTREEIIDYIKCMTITQNIDPNVYLCLTNEDIDKISNYIGAKMSATWFNERETKPGRKEVVTSEVIYYWMIAFNIPPEYQKWHLNRLMTLIRICSIKNAPPKKQSKRDIMQRNAKLNAARRKQYNSKG